MVPRLDCGSLAASYTHPMHLVMFDIDGTLVDSHGFDGDLFAAAIRRELGIQVDKTWQSYRNVTDSGILGEVLVHHVVAGERRQAYDRVKACFVDLIRDFIAQQPRGLQPVAGAPEFIRALQARSGVAVAFATGGWRETAEMKLRSVGVEFEGAPFGSSSDAEARVDIMRSAERQAAAVGAFRKRTYFGDAPWDKAASAALGYDFVAIGGRVEHTRGFEDLQDQKAIFGMLGV
jgi:beta-phosphoglucomutase-like phosphatase (HAD superfamily)